MVGQTKMIGTVNDKHTDHEYAQGAGWLTYHITVEGVFFQVSEGIYNWLSIDDEVSISYWPYTRRLIRVDK